MSAQGVWADARGASKKVGHLLNATQRRGRRLLAGVLAASLIAGPASARCAADQDQAAFDVNALKTELMLMAVSSECRRETDYNAFINRFRQQLIEADGRVVAWYRAHFGTGRTLNLKIESFVTELANQRSRAAQRVGGDYCARSSLLFTEISALPSGSDLAAYAAGKNMMPADLPACETPPAPPARRTRR